MDLQEIALDVDACERGKWVDYDHETRVKIGKVDSRTYQEAVRKYSKPHLHAIQRKKISWEKQQDITVRAICDGLLFDWQGVKYKGEELPYTPEKAYEILSDPRFGQFLEFICREAGDESQFVDYDDETDEPTIDEDEAGNSPGT